MKRLKSKVNAVTFANSEQLDARDQLWDMFHSNIMTDSEKERNMGLFIRSSMLARIFAVAEIYKEIVSLPGAIAEFGTWRGQNAVLCENFRAIFEPFNKQRKIFAFDTFEGYQTLKANDKMNHEDYKPGKFSTGANYADILTKLLGIANTRFHRASELGVEGHQTDALIHLLKKVNATHYISGPSAKDYLDESKLNATGITLEYIEYKYSEYQQLHPPYDPQVTILDLLFMQGEKAGEHIWGTA